MQEDAHTRSVKIKVGAIAALAFTVMALDEVIKILALKKLPHEGSFELGQIIDFAIHKNYGIAFNLPLPHSLVIGLTVFLIGLFLFVLIRSLIHRPDLAAASSIIIAGAVGNLIDRITYGYAVDYIILFTRSAINLSDILILIGVLLMIFTSRATKKPSNHPTI
ncbi:MAG: signal peptidase II [Candidatus Uhrbacteria bacterium]|nr:signal peptidase II [Patescibacteria group bacterium]MBU1907325.1 signal peptidase II [Patescibacteria group bacterium]